jgi:UDP-3-O-[3-hydroxymyristoyl] N-acetylglucosamine deacetylase
MYSQQHTLAKTVYCAGIGVHSGKEVNLAIRPARLNHGIKFKRTDIPESPAISAHINNVVDTSLATVIGSEGVIVSTIEHLMASLTALAIDNALIELDTYELPIMDGSAGPFTKLIKAAGKKEQQGARVYFIVKEPIEVKSDGKSVGVYPDKSFRLSCSIEFNHPLIQKQAIDIDLADGTFEKEISHARTFGFLHEVEYMRRFGLARGGSLYNAVVIDNEKVVNEGGLRYPDEFVRHKLIDCIGDFSLLGMPILGHIKAYKSGHAFNHAFLKKFFEEKKSWDTSTLPHPNPISPIRSK